MKHLILAACLAFFSSSVTAHEMEAGRNGGKVVDIGSFHLEMVAEPATLTVFLTDASDEPVLAAGASGRAVIQDAGKTTIVTLDAGPDNRLSGSLTKPLSSGAVLALSARLSGGEALQARFIID